MMEDAVAAPPMVGGEKEGQPEVSDARRALVTSWEQKIIQARAHEPTKRAFKRMRDNMAFAARGADKKWIEAERYVVPVLNRHINLAVSRLYAKNPTAVAKRSRKLMYRLWDGRQDSLQAAAEMAALGDPEATQIIQEVLAVQEQNLLVDRMGKTLEVLWSYFTNEQEANFKQQLKALVRRAKVCGVGYVKLAFQRVMEPRPEVTARISDITSQITAMEELLSDVAEGEIDETSARMEELRLLLQQLQGEEEMVVREGPVFDFPRADEITIDPNCRHLKSLAGAGWVAQMYEMPPCDIEAIYGVDVGESYTRYDQSGKVYAGKKEKDCVARVHQIWDKRRQQELTICEGYHDFLKEPAAPELKTERFFPIFPLVFNEIEHDEELYPPSDVELAMHPQNEYNRSREGLRQHRIAARPYYVASDRIEEADLKKLAQHDDHEIIHLPNLADGEKVEDFLQRGPTAPIDPNLYEVEPIFTDIQRTVGTQEANFGGVSGGTATESSISEQSSSDSRADNVDDLDEMLTELARATGQVLLTEMSKESVMEIAGPGAVWPEMPETKAEVVKDLFLEIKAGSSGRPNRAAELANLERAMPIVIQIPGVNPAPYARKYSQLLEIDEEEMTAEGAPSIMALNAMMAKAAANAGGNPTGDPATDPNAQGGAGAQNAPAAQQGQPGPQPGYPTPVPGPA